MMEGGSGKMPVQPHPLQFRKERWRAVTRQELKDEIESSREENMAILNRRDPENGWIPIANAIYYGASEEVVAFLYQSNKEMSILFRTPADQKAYNLLHLAAMNNHDVIPFLMFAHYRWWDEKNGHGYTPLEWAKKYGLTELHRVPYEKLKHPQCTIVDYLKSAVDKGIEAGYIHNLWEFDVSRWRVTPSSHIDALLKKEQYSQIRLADKPLPPLNGPLGVCEPKLGNIPLANAIYFGSQVEVIEFMFSLGREASIAWRDKQWGMNLIHLAACQANVTGGYEIISYLLYEFGYEYANLTVAEDLEQNDLAANTQGQTPLDIAGDERSRQMFLNPIEAIKSYISSVTKGDICAGMISYLHDKTKIKWHVTSLRHVQHLLRYFGSTSDVKGALNQPGKILGWLPIMCAVCGGASLEVVAYMLEQNKTESLAFRSATDGTHLVHVA
eukprot:g906.t1